MASLHDTAARLIEERTGLTMAHHTQALLDDILQGDLAATVDQMARAPLNGALWQHIITELTIGETYFMRDSQQFKRLRETIMPQLIAKRRQHNTHSIAVWSAGCATGEEAYSLAITLFEHLPDHDRWQLHIHGTDINQQAITTARHGVYRDWAFRHTSEQFQKAYFDPVDGGWQIKAALRETVTFDYHNLLTPIDHSFDLILCRNVLIYFQPDYRAQAERTLTRALKPGGWLFLGPSEVLHTAHERITAQQDAASLAYQHADSQQQHKPPHRSSETTLTTNANDIYNNSVDALHDGDAERAQRLVQPLLMMTPYHVPSHVFYASLLTDQRRYEEALTHLDTALEIDPLHADGHYLQALIYQEQDDHDCAITALRAALYCQRNHPLATVMLATHYQQQGDTVKAQRYWQNAHQAIRSLMPHSPVTNISDVTAEQLRRLITAQLTPG
jgi:chemotaxis protein methyltransferase CheR